MTFNAHINHALMRNHIEGNVATDVAREQGQKHPLDAAIALAKRVNGIQLRERFGSQGAERAIVQILEE